MEKLLILLAGLLFAALIITPIIALVVWLAWGAVAVTVFHAPALTFVQCWAALILLAVVGSYFRSSK
jgi:hypothetical protein